MRFSIIPGLTLALFGKHISADCCKNGLDYCGYGLLAKGWTLHIVVSQKFYDANYFSSTQQAITMERFKLRCRGLDIQWILIMCGTRSSTAAPALTPRSLGTVVLTDAQMEERGTATIAASLLDATLVRVMDWDSMA